MQIITGKLNRDKSNHTKRRVSYATIQLEATLIVPKS